VWRCVPVIPAFGKWRQENWEFKVGLSSYVLSSRTAWVLAGFVCQLDTSQSHQRKEPSLGKCLYEIQL
jgi:predicted Zn-dependent protease